MTNPVEKKLMMKNKRKRFGYIKINITIKQKYNQAAKNQRRVRDKKGQSKQMKKPPKSQQIKKKIETSKPCKRIEKKTNNITMLSRFHYDDNII